MSRITIYKCDRCGKEMKIDERIHFEASVREHFKMVSLKKFDLCQNCADKLVSTTLGTEYAKEINEFVPESKR